MSGHQLKSGHKVFYKMELELLNQRTQSFRMKDSSFIINFFFQLVIQNPSVLQ